jgi:hypothetical protein
MWISAWQQNVDVDFMVSKRWKDGIVETFRLASVFLLLS